jgi:uncharacterized membrane protein
MNLKYKVFTILALISFVLAASSASAFLGGKFKTLKPKAGSLYIPVADVSDGKAHYFKAKAEDGIMVDFFVVQSGDGVIRAAIDSCDVCYRSGKGYVQDGNVMVCTNCGRRFATDRINEVKGGCNPAPLKRVIQGDNLVISMNDINQNSWYCKFK